MPVQYRERNQKARCIPAIQLLTLWIWSASVALNLAAVTSTFAPRFLKGIWRAIRLELSTLRSTRLRRAKQLLVSPSEINETFQRRDVRNCHFPSTLFSTWPPRVLERPRKVHRTSALLISVEHFHPRKQLMHINARIGHSYINERYRLWLEHT